MAFEAVGLDGEGFDRFEMEKERRSDPPSCAAVYTPVSPP
jgi:hypothetical protein